MVLCSFVLLSLTCSIQSTAQPPSGRRLFRHSVTRIGGAKTYPRRGAKVMYNPVAALNAVHAKSSSCLALSACVFAGALELLCHDSPSEVSRVCSRPALRPLDFVDRQGEEMGGSHFARSARESQSRLALFAEIDGCSQNRMVQDEGRQDTLSDQLSFSIVP
jgi:hypothetical protein